LHRQPLADPSFQQHFTAIPGRGKLLAMSKIRNILLACVILCLAGCIDRVLADDDVVYTYANWVRVVVTVGLLAVCVFGVIRVRQGNRLGYMAIGFPMVALILIGPTSLQDRVTIGPDRLYLNTGFWFSPNIHEVRLPDVARAAIEVEHRQRRSGQQKSFYINFELKSGQKDRFPVGDVMHVAMPEILDHLKQKNIPVYLPPDAAGL
jgi:hypothetical protein